MPLIQPNLFAHLADITSDLSPIGNVTEIDILDGKRSRLFLYPQRF